MSFERPWWKHQCSKCCKTLTPEHRGLKFSKQAYYNQLCITNEYHEDKHISWFQWNLTLSQSMTMLIVMEKNRKDISENHHGLANFSLILVRSRNLSIEWHTVFAYITGSTLGTVCITSPTLHSLLIVLWTRNVHSGWWLTSDIPHEYKFRVLEMAPFLEQQKWSIEVLPSAKDSIA